ncbi:MAG: hypothetical protein ACKVRN_00200 [Pyrinomonadaceae bacterium]
MKSFILRLAAIHFVLIGFSCTSLENRRHANVENTVEADGFPVDNICSLPRQAAPDTIFATLGNGKWGRWNETTNPEVDFGCEGGKDMITLKSNDEVEIIVEFGVIGGKKTAHDIGPEYMSSQYSGLALNDKQYRQQFADFCNKLSEKLFSTGLSDQVFKRLLDETTYSPSGTRNQYAEAVGKGIVSLSSNMTKARGVYLRVSFYSSEAEYERYK